MFSGDVCAVVAEMGNDGEFAVGIGNIRLIGLLSIGTCLLLVSSGCWRPCVRHGCPPVYSTEAVVDAAGTQQPGCDDSCSPGACDAGEEMRVSERGCRTCRHLRPLARLGRPVVEAAYYNHPRFHPVPVRPVFSPRFSPVPTSDALIPEVLPTPPALPPEQIELIPPGAVPEQIRTRQPQPEHGDRLTREPRAFAPAGQAGSWIFRPSAPQVSNPLTAARLERQGGDEWRVRR